jgi:hypothetical protein
MGIEMYYFFAVFGFDGLGGNFAKGCWRFFNSFNWVVIK